VATNSKNLALDVHGGDFGPAVTIPAALDILASQADVEILLCGMVKDIQPKLGRHASSDRLTIIEASHALASDARPVEALRWTGTGLCQRWQYCCNAGARC